MFGYLRDILLAILAVKVAQSDLFLKGANFLIQQAMPIIQARIPSNVLSALNNGISGIPCIVVYYFNAWGIAWGINLLITGYVIRMFIRQLPFGGK